MSDRINNRLKEGASMDRSMRALGEVRLPLFCCCVFFNSEISAVPVDDFCFLGHQIIRKLSITAPVERNEVQSKKTAHIPYRNSKLTSMFTLVFTDFTDARDCYFCRNFEAVFWRECIHIGFAHCERMLDTQGSDIRHAEVWCNVQENNKYGISK